MPGEHSKNTQLLGFWADDELVARIDSVRDGARSQFMREAAVEYLVAKGVQVPENLRHAPDRTGKGGPKRTNSKADAAASRVLSKGVASVSYSKSKRRRSRGAGGPSAPTSGPVPDADKG